MKILHVLTAATAVALLTLPGFAQTGFAQTKSVAITAIVEHPALDSTRDGVIAGLKEAGFIQGENLKIDYQTAQGNQATAVQIARRFIGQKPDAIVPISTPSAQAVAAATKDVPVVFADITDPLGAQLVTSLEKPGGNVTGVSDMAPVGEQVALIQEIIPSAKRLGVVYNPGEPNSVTLVKALKAEAAKRGLSVVEAAATKSSEVQTAGRSLIGKVDAIYVPLDNTVVSALEALASVGSQAKLPVFSADTDSVGRGAMASIGFDYFQVGKQAGAMVARVLKGEKVGDIPVAFAKGADLSINLKAAASMGVTFPESVIKRATKTIGQ